MRFASTARTSSEPLWLREARQHIGQKEIPGKESNPWIVSLWNKAKNVFSWLGSDDSSAPWCGAFVAHCVASAGLPIPPHFYRAKAWLDWGIQLDTPAVGCVVVYERKGGGHVGFVVGRDQRGNLMTLGGNQGDSVSVAPFATARVAGYRWPAGEVVSLVSPPLMDSDGEQSTNES